MKKGVTIKSAKYLKEYKIEILFSDGKVNVFDYKNLVLRGHEECIPYRDIDMFKKFKIVSNSEIAWGDNWDMLLPLNTLYNKSYVSNAGRKAVNDKKVLARLYVKESVIQKHGGIKEAQIKATQFLNDI